VPLPEGEAGGGRREVANQGMVVMDKILLVE